MGAGISSIVCQFVAFLITFTVLRKNIKLQFKVGRMVLAPICAATIMGIDYLFYQSRSKPALSLPNLCTIISIILGAIIYGILILLFKILKKEDMMMIPWNKTICSIGKTKNI